MRKCNAIECYEKFHALWKGADPGISEVEDQREKIEVWRREYNEFRSHSSLDGLTPQQFVDTFESEQSQEIIFLAGTVFG